MRVAPVGPMLLRTLVRGAARARRRALGTNVVDMASLEALTPSAVRYSPVSTTDELRSRVFRDNEDLKNKAIAGDYEAWRAIVTEHQEKVRDEVRGDSGLQTPYDTSVSRAMIGTTSAIARGLSDNTFVGKTGGSTKCLIGRKGLGKSTNLLFSTLVVPVLFENVKVVYVSFENPDDVLHYDLATTVRKALEGCLGLESDDAHLEGLSAYDRASESDAWIRKTLTKEEWKLMLYLDEFECLYTIRVDDDIASADKEKAYRIATNAHLSLNFLYAAADSLVRQGRFGAILTGSKTMFPRLFDLSAMHLGTEFRSEFPFLTRARNLNVSRFKCQWVRPKMSRLLSDTEEILKQLALCKPAFKSVMDRLEEENKVQQFTGIVAAKTMGNARMIESELGLLLHDERTVSNMSVNSATETIMERLLQKLREKNSGLDHFTPESFAKMKPLTEAEVKRCIASPATRNEILCELEDKDLITRIVTNEREDAFMVTDLTRWGTPEGQSEWAFARSVKRRATELLEP